MRVALTAALLVLSGMAYGQDTQEALVQKRDAKLKAEFFKKAVWITEFDKAREEAKKSNQLIFAYFTRSYAA